MYGVLYLGYVVKPCFVWVCGPLTSVFQLQTILVRGGEGGRGGGEGGAMKWK